MEKFIKETLFPHYCLLCKKEKFLLCPNCQKTLKIKTSPSCPVCQKTNNDFSICQNCKKENNFTLDGIFVTAFWKDPIIKKLIYLFKYEFIQEAGEILNKTLIDFVKLHKILDKNKESFILAPIPLHHQRENWRGFNQSEIFSRFLASNFNISNTNDLLKRNTETLPQMNIHDAKERKLNVYEAFALGPGYTKGILKDKTVILIDDITTTGSTLNECAKVLKKYKPRKIYGLVLAQA